MEEDGQDTHKTEENMGRGGREKRYPTTSEMAHMEAGKGPRASAFMRDLSFERTSQCIH